jgi:hypothetical protein
VNANGGGRLSVIRASVKAAKDLIDEASTVEEGDPQPA